MAVNNVTPPYVTFKDTDGSALDAGYVYIGEPGLNAEANRKAAYWDEALTIPVNQPIRTSGGFAFYEGSPGRIYTTGDYSIVVKNRVGELVQSRLNAGILGAGDPIHVETVADMVAAAAEVGDVFQTMGYSEAGDAGENTYIIRASTYQPSISDDAGYLITLANGLRAEGQFPDGLSPMQWGAAGDGVADDRTPWQACLTHAARIGAGLIWLSQPNSDFPAKMNIDGKGKLYALSGGLNLTAYNTNNHLVNASFVAIAGTWNTTIGATTNGGPPSSMTDYDFPAGDYMFDCKSNATYITFDGLAVDCDNRCSGFLLRFGCAVKNTEITRIGGYGIRTVRGNCKVIGCEIEQWNKNDPEYYDRTAFTAVGIYFGNSDALVSDCKIRWLWACVVADDTNNRIVDSHIFNGMRDYPQYEIPDDNTSGNSRTDDLNDALDAYFNYTPGTAEVTNFPPRTHHAGIVTINSSGTATGNPDNVFANVYLDNCHCEIYEPGFTVQGLYLGSKPTSSLSAPTATSGNNGLPATYPAVYGSGTIDYWLRFHAYKADSRFVGDVTGIHPLVEGLTKQLVEFVSTGSNSWDANSTFYENSPLNQSDEEYGDGQSIQKPRVEVNVDQRDTAGISRPATTVVTLGDGSFHAFADKNTTDLENAPKVGAQGDTLVLSSPEGVEITVDGTGNVVINADAASGRYLRLVGLPTSSPGGSDRVWKNAGSLDIT